MCFCVRGEGNMIDCPCIYLCPWCAGGIWNHLCLRRSCLVCTWKLPCVHQVRVSCRFLPPTSIILWCHDYLNSYNRIYNTITKYSITTGLVYYSWIWCFWSLNSYVQNFTKIYKTDIRSDIYDKTLVSALMHAYARCMHLSGRTQTSAMMILNCSLGSWLIKSTLKWPKQYSSICDPWPPQ